MTSNNIKKLITHNGSFHTDDIFACATLILKLEKDEEKYEIIRTRDPEIINEGDYVFDVGGIYDEASNRFDHHQVGGAGKHNNGIEYSSFGLLWKKWGVVLSGNEKVAELIENELVSPIDAVDNGIDLVEFKNSIKPFFVQDFFRSMRPTWREENITLDQMFLKSVSLAKEILSREIIHAKDVVLAKERIASIYLNTRDKKILIFDEDYPSADILQTFPEPLYVVYPRPSDGFWGVKAVRDNSKSFKNRKDFPKTWSGLTGEELARITNVPDAVFCHRALFLAIAKSQEGAIKLAQIAVES